jgi:hypothetical protein
VIVAAMRPLLRLYLRGRGRSWDSGLTLQRRFLRARRSAISVPRWHHAYSRLGSDLALFRQSAVERVNPFHNPAQQTFVDHCVSTGGLAWKLQKRTKPGLLQGTQSACARRGPQTLLIACRCYTAESYPRYPNLI